MPRIFKHRQTGQIIAKTPTGMMEYVRGRWCEPFKDLPNSDFTELAITEYPTLYAGLERQRTWKCCGGIPLYANEKCSVCGEYY